MLKIAHKTLFMRSHTYGLQRSRILKIDQNPVAAHGDSLPKNVTLNSDVVFVYICPEMGIHFPSRLRL